MERALESSETQGRRGVGAELAHHPDGSTTLRLATAAGLVGARGYLHRGAPALLALGPAGFSSLLGALAHGLAARAGQALVLQPFAGRDPALDLGAAAGFLRRDRTPRLLLAGAGELAPATLEAARDLDAEAVLLLSPIRTPDPHAAQRLGGRALVVCTASPGQARAVAALPHAQAFAFPGAGPALAEVEADLLAQLLPVLERALGLGASAREA